MVEEKNPLLDIVMALIEWKCSRCGYTRIGDGETICPKCNGLMVGMRIASPEEAQ